MWPNLTCRPGIPVDRMRKKVITLMGMFEPGNS
jgi:hypothetical protein